MISADISEISADIFRHTEMNIILADMVREIRDVFPAIPIAGKISAWYGPIPVHISRYEPVSTDFFIHGAYGSGLASLRSDMGFMS